MRRRRMPSYRGQHALLNTDTDRQADRQRYRQTNGHLAMTQHWHSMRAAKHAAAAAYDVSGS